MFKLKYDFTHFMYYTTCIYAFIMLVVPTLYFFVKLHGFIQSKN